ncbi:MAG: TIR domain-containing protein [Cyanobacteria bacterium]|nr:TIR domain-containing protein [Cyanobacteriota bacterium]
MAYRNKVYVCFDGDKDITHYRLLKAWYTNPGINFDFFDAHNLIQARDTSTTETIKRSLQTRLLNTREFMVLIGESTKYLYKFVRWEIEVAQDMQLPIIAVNLNGKKRMDPQLCPALIRDNLAIHVPFKSESISYALKNWPSSAAKLRAERKKGAFYYTDDVYQKLGVRQMR